MNGYGSFVSQLAISRIEVYNMIFREKDREVIRVLEEYYEEMGELIECFIRDFPDKLNIIGAYYIPHDSPREYFRLLARTLETHLVDSNIGSEIMGFIASTRCKLENAYA